MECLRQPLTVRGVNLRNRAVKAATSECLGRQGRPTQELLDLYRNWARAKNPPGLIISGHVMTDDQNVAQRKGLWFPSSASAEDQERWGASMRCLASSVGLPVLFQISSAGPQVPICNGRAVVGPSSTANANDISSLLFRNPHHLTESEINEIPTRFARVASLVTGENGAVGVEIHAAHGYLLHSLISPTRNPGQFLWGVNFLCKVVTAVRNAMPSGCLLFVKLGSSDFSAGGLTPLDARFIIRKLGELNAVDVIELSGGTYQQAAFLREKETLQRRSLMAAVRAGPRIMITGGVRTSSEAERLLADCDLIGFARPFLLNPDFLDTMPPMGLGPRLHPLITYFMRSPLLVSGAELEASLKAARKRQYKTDWTMGLIESIFAIATAGINVLFAPSINLHELEALRS